MIKLTFIIISLLAAWYFVADSTYLLGGLHVLFMVVVIYFDEIRNSD